MVQPKYVKVQFVAEWMGNPIGSKINMIESQANSLLQRGTVLFVDDKVAKELDIIKTKQIDAPPIHRMIESSPVKKAGRPRKLK